MKVILKEKVKSLGNVGEIHNVSPGYGRNFLIRNNLATLADEGNTRTLNDQKKALAKKIDAEKSEAIALQKKLTGHTVTITKKVGGSGRLFGTVTSSELSESLAKDNLEVEKRSIFIETPIKQVGTFEVKVKLFEGVEAAFNVKVEKDAKQAVEDAKRAKEAKANKEAARAQAEEAKKASAIVDTEGEETSEEA